MKLASLAVPLLAAATASAQLATYNTGEGIEYALSIPRQTVQSGSGDIFFQLMGPANFQWIAMGFGSQMAGSMIFVMYANGAGNVTVSPRKGVGEVEPEFWSQPQIELMPGTGIMNGKMMANVRCSNCESWDGGKLDFSSSSQDFIWAHRTGPAIDSRSKSAELEQHQQIGQTFQFNLQQAAGGSPTNPFSAAATQAAGGAGATSSGSQSSEPSITKLSMILKAHGIIMGLTVVLLFPIGSLLMRVFSFRMLWAVHAAWQILSLFMLTAGFGLGYWFAGNSGEALKYEGEGFTHTVFGTVIFAFFWLQPVLGFAAHWMYKKQGGRNMVSHAHMWFGRIIMILAIINGGLGLQLADNTTGGEIAYGVIAGIMGVIYIAVVGFVEGRKLTSGGKKSNAEKAGSSGS